jgi:AcrR family transcriptional regulator
MRHLSETAGVSTAASERRHPRHFSPTALRILEESARLFSEQGFSATSTRDIAQVIGIQQPGLYKHFQSKDAILAALYELAMGYPTEVGAALLERPEPAIVRLYRWLSETTSHLNRAPFVLTSLLRTPELRNERFHSSRFIPDGGHRFCTELIAAAIAEGDAADRDPAASAWFTLGLIDSMTIPPHEIDEEELLRYAFDALLADRRSRSRVARQAAEIELGMRSPLLSSDPTDAG